jgi:hypothetical protein
MASAQFRLIGHSLRVFEFLQQYPNEWHDSVELARKVGAKIGVLGPAMRSLERANYAILENRTTDKARNRVWIHSVERPGHPSCFRCGVALAGDYERLCKTCLPHDPAKAHPDVQPGSPTKIDLLTARYAAGLPLWPEPYTSPMPGRASEERSYDDSHLLRALRGR